MCLTGRWHKKKHAFQNTVLLQIFSVSSSVLNTCNCPCRVLCSHHDSVDFLWDLQFLKKKNVQNHFSNWIDRALTDLYDQSKVWIHLLFAWSWFFKIFFPHFKAMLKASKYATISFEQLILKCAFNLSPIKLRTALIWGAVY